MPKQVLLVGPVPPQIGGVEFFVAAMLKSPLSRQFSIRHFDISKPRSRSHAEFDSPSGYARSFTRKPWLSLLSFGYSLGHFLRYLCLIPSRRIGLVHLHASSYMSFWEKCLFQDVARLWGKRVVMHIHGSSFDRFVLESGPVSQRLILWHLRSCDKVVALSESWRRFFSRFLPADRIATIENGIDLDLYRDFTPAPDPEPTIVFLGEVCTRKGVYDLLPALALIKEKMANVRCLFIGPGELGRARQKAIELGLQENAIFLGPLWDQDKSAALARGWCFTLPSHAEVFPLTILDAYAAALPVVSTRIGGIPDFVIPDENGLLIDAGDPPGLADALLRLLTDAQMRARMARTNRQQAFELYDMAVCAAKVGQVYAALLAGK